MSDTIPANAYTFTPVDEPPARRGGPGRLGGAYLPALNHCRQNPGQWIKLDGVFGSEATGKIKRGKVVGAEAGEFDAVLRNFDSDTKRGDLYIRYVGAVQAGLDTSES